MPPAGSPVIIDVRRDFILVDALKEAKKAKFNPRQPLSVCILKYYFVVLSDSVGVFL